MSKSLVIVESPGKIKKIQSYLGSDYVVAASRGHIMDLDKAGISIDIDNNFEPNYVINPDKKAVVSELKKHCTSCTTVYLAADEDREGEFIAESLKQVLKLKNYKRAVFHEITQSAIMNAINNPKMIDDNLVKAQQTRRFLDRIVGYKLSPLLSRIQEIGSDVNRHKLGAGRVQSVIVKIIIDKENEINEFLESSRSAFYEGKGLFNLMINDKSIDLDTTLYTTNPSIKKFELIKLDDSVYDTVLEIMMKLKDCKWKLFEIKKRIINRSPTAPFITSSLQREAAGKLHWSIKKTMEVAQKLYEDGMITYMRTDSTVLSEDAHKKIKEFVISQFGDNYYSYKQYTSKSQNAQEAHECIRPCDFTKLSVDDSDKDKLYKLIWKKTVSSQMSKAQIESTQLFLAPTNKLDYLMSGSISRIVFDGYLKLYKDLDEDEKITDINIPDDLKLVKVTPKWIKIKESLTSPPARYNESSLVETLEKQGIGRPSTYANMVAKIQEKDYIRVENVEGKEKILKELMYDCGTNKLTVIDNKMFLGKENKRMVPTNLGMILNNFLIKNFPEIMNIKFTAQMEQDLDEIAKGKKIWVNVLRGFYDVINNQIQSFLKSDLSKNILAVKVFTNNVIIGTHPESGQEITLCKTKFGLALKMFEQELNKDIWVNVKSKVSLEEAVKLFNDKQESKDKPESKSTVIKTIDKYQIKQGPYGPYIQTGTGPKNIKFYKIYGDKDLNEITLEDCKKICVNKTKKFTKKNEI